MPKFASKTQRVKVGNGQCVAVLFVIPVIVDIHGHRFEVFTLVSEIHDNVDLVLGMKNVSELEGVIDMQDSFFQIFQQIYTILFKRTSSTETKERKFLKTEAPFVDGISGLAIIKMIDNKEQCTMVLKLKFVRNQASLDVTNNTQEMMIFQPKQMLGILNLRSLGYYKIKQGVLQQNLSKCYHFESAEKLREEFNTLVNKLKKDENTADKEKYPWLEVSDERKKYDREILDKYIDPDKSCLTDSEKTQVRYMIYKYKDAFSLRDEIGTCPNIEIDLDITDKMPFFIRPYHVREEDKRILEKDMKRLCS